LLPYAGFEQINPPRVALLFISKCSVPVACVSLALRFPLTLEAAAARLATLHMTQQQQQQQQP
jgi:hypothetical protein